jgi:hypothetical protein
MSISSLRWRATLALGAAAAAVLALAVPAGASTGTRWTSPEQAGYIATGAQFKTISTHVYLRNPAQYAGKVASYRYSVQLWSSGLVVTIGLKASTSGTRYTPYATIYNRSTHQVIASNPNTPGFQPFGFGKSCELVINYRPATGYLTMYASFGYGPDFSSYYRVSSQSFTQARVGTEFGSSPWDASYPYTPPARSLKVAAYTNVDLTSYSGHTASLSSWWVHHKLLANTGQQSGSDWVAVPADLSNGGASFQTFFLPQSAQGRP